MEIRLNKLMYLQKNLIEDVDSLISFLYGKVIIQFLNPKPSSVSTIKEIKFGTEYVHPNSKSKISYNTKYKLNQESKAY